MAIFDWKCEKCGNEFEYLIMGSDDVAICDKCGSIEVKKMAPQSPVTFKLIYDNKTDMVDWDGNKSRYYDKYKEMKRNGENPRIPELDGETR